MTSQPHEPELHPLADIDTIIHAPARLMVLAYLYVVDSVDYVFLLRQTGLTWGSLSTHLSKLEEAGYITIEKGYREKNLTPPFGSPKMDEQPSGIIRKVCSRCWMTCPINYLFYRETAIVSSYVAKDARLPYWLKEYRAIVRISFGRSGGSGWGASL